MKVSKPLTKILKERDTKISKNLVHAKKPGCASSKYGMLLLICQKLRKMIRSKYRRAKISYAFLKQRKMENTDF